ncbi:MULTISPECIES: hypothetical protein [unclassified Streptomyces]|uniref:hypothetical protein n=1 Tax=unclassified Streptomyces TaxID=2593676 RepID=UPI001C577DE7|nr:MULTISPECIES: hypothetical protein [unclassified Streptomyces]
MDSKELTKKEMEAILLAHEVAELEQDVDATMATLAPNPHYELAGLGWAVDGTAAVRATYERILSYVTSRNVAAERRVHAVAKNHLIREAHVTFDNRKGERVTGLYMVVMEFDPELKLIAGERMYMDPVFAEMMAEHLGDDFGDLPGVSKIGDSAPLIEKHDAYRVAASRGITINAPK